MIKKYSLYLESEEHYTLINFNDLWDEYKKNIITTVIIHSLIRDIFKFGTKIEFKCKNCYGDSINDARMSFRREKSHTGKVRGYGSGTYQNGDLYLSVMLINERKKDEKGRQIHHEIDLSCPMKVYGEISEENARIIKNNQVKKRTSKFGL